jgi:hypothetical protein
MTPTSAGLKHVRQSHIMTDGRSVIPSWCRAPSGTPDEVITSVKTVAVSSLWGALSNERSDSMLVCSGNFLLALAAQSFLVSAQTAPQQRTSAVTQILRLFRRHTTIFFCLTTSLPPLCSLRIWLGYTAR